MGRHSRKGRAKAGQPPERPRGDAPPSYGMADNATGESRSQAAYAQRDPHDEGVPDGYGRGYGVRGGHPEHRERGGGWGADRSGRRPGGEAVGRVLQGTPGTSLGAGRSAGPRQEYIDAFDDGVFGTSAGVAASAAVRAPAPRHPGAGHGADAFHGGLEPETSAGKGSTEGFATGRLLPDPGPAPLQGPRARRPSAPGSWNAPGNSVAFAKGSRTDVQDGRIGTDRTRSAANGNREESGSSADGGLPRAAPPPRVPGDGVRPGTRGSSSMGKAFTGVLAAAVTTVLAFVVAGQITNSTQPGEETGENAAGAERGLSADGPASRSGKGRGAPAEVKGAAPTYEQKMGDTLSLDADFKGKGGFKAVAGTDDGAGGSDVMRYRVDVEKGLPLESELFTQAVEKTLNDKRSWAHGGERSFKRVAKGDVDFVITLASSPTTDVWCAKSGLDTSQDKVSCDSASTDRVMINAYRWAQGSKTFGDDRMFSYRQMLINHEVGHRIGRDHVGCPKDGALAPVMMQQTKSLTTDGAKCRPNPWPYPRG